MAREAPDKTVVSPPRICLNCGDNRATDNSVICRTCNNKMIMGEKIGDEL